MSEIIPSFSNARKGSIGIPVSEARRFSNKALSKALPLFLALLTNSKSLSTTVIFLERSLDAEVTRNVRATKNLPLC